MRCLYIVANEPISPNYVGGGSAIYYEQLVSLVELGIEVSLWHFSYENRAKSFEEFISKDEDWDYINSLCENVVLTTIPVRPTFTARAMNRLSNTLTGPEIRNPLLRAQGLPVLKRLISTVEPQFIWAQHFAPAQIALLQKRIPVIYSHHDWLYRVKSISKNNGFDLLQKQMEEKVVRQVAAVTSGSMIECNELKAVGSRNVHYIPVAYEKAPIAADPRHGKRPRLLHLGGSGTTASRVGLERFFEIVWPKLKGSGDQMWVIGDMSAATGKLHKYLEQVHTTGYVSDLATVMRPYDIHVIPWEYETGQRTRLVSAFNYNQAVVATRKSVSCFPEVVSGKNCLLIDDLEEMPNAILQLLNNDELRRKLADNARETFQKYFTRESLLPRYRDLVNSISKEVLS